MASVFENNNRVLEKLWNDPDVNQLTQSMSEIMPRNIRDGEVIVDDDHLREAGYIGTPPRFSLGVGNIKFYRAVVIYSDYWIRFHSKTPTTHLYSIFKEKK